MRHSVQLADGRDLNLPGTSADVGAIWTTDAPFREAVHRRKDIQFRAASPVSRRGSNRRIDCGTSSANWWSKFRPSRKATRRELAGYGCKTQMHVVRLMAPRIENESHTKDIDFSASGIRARREAGYAATRRALERAPWRGEFDPIGRRDSPRGDGTSERGGIVEAGADLMGIRNWSIRVWIR